MKLLFYIFMVVSFFSCQTEETTVLLNKNTKGPSKYREAGQIPHNIKYKDDVLLMINEKNESHVLLIKYYRNHGSKDYYSNLFELTLNEILQHIKVNELSDEALLFIVNQIDRVESNLINLTVVPVLFDQVLEKNLINYTKYQKLANDIIDKNEKEINKIQWSNQRLKELTLKDFDYMKMQLLYKRSKYQYLIN